MATAYDSVFAYDVSGGYDAGPSVPVVVPSHTNSIRAPFSPGTGKSVLLRGVWTVANTRQLPIRFGGSNTRYDSGAPYDQNGVYDGSDGRPSPMSSMIRAHWLIVAPRVNDIRLPLGSALPREAIVRARWSHIAPYQHDTRLRIDSTTKRLVNDLRMSWDSLRGREHATRIRWGDASPRQSEITIPWARVDGRESYVRIRWRPGYPFRSGYTIPFGGEPDPPPGSTIIVPSADAYFMIPSLSITRDSDGADLDAIDASIKLDSSSYAWTIDATIPRQTLSLVDPATNDDPVQVTATINGYEWRFLIEGYTDNRKFGGTGCKIRGRSLSALLGAPYAPLATFTNSSNRDVSQLANDLMPTGWTCTWSTQDWLVPAGLFTYADLAPIDALALLVNAVGGIIVPDPVDQTLTIQPLYQTSPWQWSGATPYADLPSSFIVEIAGQWEGNFKTAYNGVYVSGQNSGIVGLVKLTGSAGDILLPTVTDQLLCVQAANVERGRIELAKASKQKTETFRTLLLVAGGADNPGVFPIGSLISVTEPAAWASAAWRGMVGSVQIDATKGTQPSSAMSVRQTLQVERHG